LIIETIQKQTDYNRQLENTLLNTQYETFEELNNIYYLCMQQSVKLYSEFYICARFLEEELAVAEDREMNTTWTSLNDRFKSFRNSSNASSTASWNTDTDKWRQDTFSMMNEIIISLRDLQIYILQQEYNLRKLKLEKYFELEKVTSDAEQVRKTKDWEDDSWIVFSVLVTLIELEVVYKHISILSMFTENPYKFYFICIYHMKTRHGLIHHCWMYCSCNVFFQKLQSGAIVALQYIRHRRARWCRGGARRARADACARVRRSLQ
jgi:hypothetical protein